MCIFFRYIFISFQYSKLVKEYNSGKYENVIKKAEKMREQCLVASALARTSQIITKIDSLNLMIAVSYLSKENHDKFLENIQAIKKMEKEKQFWLVLHNLLTDNINQAQIHHALYLNLSKKDDWGNAYLKGMFLFKQGQTIEAFQFFEIVQPKVLHPLLKKYLSNM